MQRQWKLKPDPPDIQHLADKTGITVLQARLLANRGIVKPAEVEPFLSPRLTHMLDPMGMKDMAEAVAIVTEAIFNREKITVFGDYDADGLTAAALLSTFLSHMGALVSTYIPDRLHEGYGLNKTAIQQIRACGTGLIITVDCGVANRSEAVLASRLGMKMVVTDHHRVPARFEMPCPVINPHQPMCPFSFKDLSGVGVAFFLAVALRKALREGGWFRTQPEPDLRDYLDLVALGTIADRVPLSGQNRILVANGVARMENSIWPGLRALMRVSGVDQQHLTADDLAYRMAPRLNAPGRLGDSLLGLKMLMEDQIQKAGTLAAKADACNLRRQELEQVVFEQAEAMVANQMEERRSVLLSGEDWHIGVLGIVASRLVERFHRPVMLAAVNDGVAKGSGRSIDGFDLYGALKRLEHYFERFGGHYHAAGFTLPAESLAGLAKDLELEASENFGSQIPVPVVEIDAELSLQQISADLISQIQALSPFGEGNPEPVFMTRRVRILESRIVADRHLKVRLGKGGQNFDAIGFGLGDRHPLKGATLDVLFTPEINRWQGREQVQLKIIDLSR